MTVTTTWVTVTTIRGDGYNHTDDGYNHTGMAVTTTANARVMRESPCMNEYGYR